MPKVARQRRSKPAKHKTSWPINSSTPHVYTTHSTHDLEESVAGQCMTSLGCLMQSKQRAFHGHTSYFTYTISLSHELHKR